MKIRAGWKLYAKKARHEPVNVRATKAVLEWLEIKDAANSVKEEMTHTPDAKPSIPSIKFSILISANTQTTVNRAAIGGENKIIPDEEGDEIPCIDIPCHTGMNATPM
jgi:hypothetical protein